MARSFTHYWTNATWEETRQKSFPGELFDSSRGNQFEKMGIRHGDRIYAVTIIKGDLYVGGRLTVGAIGQHPRDGWREELRAAPGTATAQRYDVKVSFSIAKRLEFRSGKRLRRLKTIPRSMFYSQAIVGVRELTATSARLLDAIIDQDKDDSPTFPDEVPPDKRHPEGGTSKVLVNMYERSARARRQCLAHYGRACVVCKVDPADRYGDAGQHAVHVHHLKMMSEIGKRYQVDPIKDLRPICPNCHAVVHSCRPPMDLDVLARTVRSYAKVNDRRTQLRAGIVK